MGVNSGTIGAALDEAGAFPYCGKRAVASDDAAALVFHYAFLIRCFSDPDLIHNSVAVGQEPVDLSGRTLYAFQ